MTKSILFALAASCALSAQSFEVASVKLAPPINGSFRMGVFGGPGSSDPGMITADNMPLKTLLMRAYGLKSYQITGPDWLTSERFNIVAKVPEGATAEQVSVMWQHLLSERFQMMVHRETKELPVFALTVAKGGPKFSETPPPDPNAPAAVPNSAIGGGGRGAAMAPVASGGGGGMMGAIRTGPGISVGTGRGGGMMSSDRMLMSSLADSLSTNLARPVLDQTGLTGKYKITLRWSGDDATDLPADAPPPLLMAVQEQLGLKLDSRKAPIDLLIVDNVSKTPVEN